MPLVLVLPVVLEYDVLDVSVDETLVPVVSVPTVAFVFDSCLQLTANSISARIAIIANDFFISFLLSSLDKKNALR